MGRVTLMNDQLRTASARVVSLKMRLCRSGGMGRVRLAVNSLRAETQNSKMERRSVN